MPIHRKQAKAVSSQRRNCAAPALDFRQEILSEAEQQLEASGSQFERWLVPGGTFELLHEQRGNPVLGQVGEILAKLQHRFGIFLAEGEHLFELIENEDRRQQLV